MENQRKWPIGILQDIGNVDISYDIPDNYNIFSTLVISGKIDIDKLNKAIAETVKNNDALMIDVVINETESVLVYRQDNDSRDVDYYDFTTEDNDIKTNEKKVKKVLEEVVETGPKNGHSSGFLLFRIDDEEYVLVLEVNHIIFDGESCSIIFEEVSNRYNGIAVEKKEIGFSDYLDELSSEEHISGRQEMLDYCKKMREGYTDFIRWDVENRQPETTKPLMFVDTEDLQELSKRLKASAFAINIFLYHLAISVAFHQKDTLLFYPLSDREYKYRNVAGLIVEEILSRFQVEENKTIEEMLRMFNKTFFKNMKYARPGKKVDELPSFCISSLNYASDDKEFTFGDASADISVENTFNIVADTKLNLLVTAVIQNEDTTMYMFLYDESVLQDAVVERLESSFREALDILINEETVTFQELSARVWG